MRSLIRRQRCCGERRHIGDVDHGQRRRNLFPMRGNNRVTVGSHFPGFGIKDAKHLASWEWGLELEEIDSKEQPRIYERESGEWDRESFLEKEVDFNRNYTVIRRSEIKKINNLNAQHCMTGCPSSRSFASSWFTVYASIQRQDSFSAMRKNEEANKKYSYNLKKRLPFLSL